MTDPNLPPKKKRPIWGRWYAITGYVIVGLVLIFAISSIGGDETTAGPPPAEETQQQEQEPAKDPACMKVDTKLVKSIGEGLTHGAQLVDPAAAQAVKSDDFDNVYMVAAALDIDGSEQIAVWAVGGSVKFGEHSGIFAADGIAQEFSDWGSSPGGTELDASAHGISEATACLGA